MRNCKVCGRRAESEYCFQHKPRKAIPIKNKEKKLDGNANNMWNFFLVIWGKRKHECTNCGKWLGREPLSYMFDHLLEKSKYPELKYEEDNIALVCMDCHSNKTNGFPSEKIKKLIDNARTRFNI